VKEALQHPYFAQYYDDQAQATAPDVEQFRSFDFEDMSEEDLKELMFRYAVLEMKTIDTFTTSSLD
jgi:hypothetical protein